MIERDPSKAPSVDVIICTSEAKYEALLHRAYDEGASFMSGVQASWFRSETLVYPDGNVVRFEWPPQEARYEKAEAEIARLRAALHRGGCISSTPDGPPGEWLCRCGARRNAGAVCEYDLGPAYGPEADHPVGLRVTP